MFTVSDLNSLQKKYLQSMAFTAKQIADFLKGEIVGNPDVKVSGFQR